MNRESHQQYLEKAARRAAIRAKEKAAEKPLAIEDVRHLRIQTVEPWKRVLLLAVGVVCGGAGMLALAGDIVWLAVVLFILAFLCVAVALVGRKRTIDAAFDAIDLGHVLEGIVELIDL